MFLALLDYVKRAVARRLSFRVAPAACMLTILAFFMLHGCGGAAGSGHTIRRSVDTADRDTERARTLNERAVTLIEEGELDKAYQYLQQALDADLMYGPAHNNLGKIYYEQGKFYEAAWEFEYAIKLMPNQPEPKNNLGLVLEEARKFDDAVAQYRQALELEPDNAEILGNLLRSRLARGDRDEEVRKQLQELIFKDTRPQWVEWAREQLVLLGPPDDSP